MPARPFAILFLSLALVGCGEPTTGASDGASPTDMGEPAAPYAGAIELPVRTAVDWTKAADDFGSVEAAHIVDGKGTLTFEGSELPALVYKRIPFGEYELASVVATTPTGYIVAYAYCKAGVVQSWYLETLDQSTRHQTKTPPGGTCTFVDGSNPVEIAFTKPAGELSLGALADVADVEGATLKIHGGTGSLTIEGTSYQADVFTEVDCSTCGGAGWMELHVLLRKDQTRAFAILYLVADKPGVVTLAYGFRFDRPALWPKDEVVTATWSLK